MQNRRKKEERAYSLVSTATELLKGAAVLVARELGHGLREVDVDAAVVDQHVVHLQVRRLALLRVAELDERVLQAVIWKALVEGQQITLIAKMYNNI